MSKNKLDDLTSSYLQQLLDYNPITGELFWNRRVETNPKIASWNTRYANRPAGHVNTAGYMEISIGKSRKFLVHRVVWKMTFGDNPPPILDHINRNRLDNKLNNLRNGVGGNTHNSTERPSNKSGVTGVVSYTDGRYGAAIKSEWLGTFDTFEAAIVVRRMAEAQSYGEFAPTSPAIPTPITNHTRNQTRINNSSGVCGISRAGNKWVVHIQSKGQLYHWSFNTFEEAVVCRKQAEITYPNRRKGC